MALQRLTGLPRKRHYGVKRAPCGRREKVQGFFVDVDLKGHQQHHKFGNIMHKEERKSIF